MVYILTAVVLKLHFNLLFYLYLNNNMFLLIRLSASELRMLIRYVLQMRMKNSGHIIVEMMEKLILMGDMALENISLAPFVEMDMSKIGHAGIQVSLGERSWPPAVTTRNKYVNTLI